MKKALFTLFIVSLFASQTFAQEDSIKNYPIKDYIAPDIRYRLLDLDSQLQLSGINITEREDYSKNNFGADAYLNYYEYENLSNYQGTTNASLKSSYNAQWGKTDSIKNSNYRPHLSLRSLSQSRFYNSNGTFWGLHGGIYYGFSSESSKYEEENTFGVSTGFRFNSYY